MTFDITDFGAIADGKTDCTNAIQAALNKAAECGGKVIIPPGKYLTGKLKVKGEGVRLEGSSAWGFGSDGASTLILNTDDAGCMLDITGAFGCTISGICMCGNKRGSNTHGIYLYWDRYNGGSKEDSLTIEDCRISHFTGNGIHLEHIWCFSLRHSMMYKNKGAGLYIDGWDAFILDNWFTDNQNGGILGNLVASITCTGNRVEWNRRGGFILPKGDSYNITGNFFDRTFGPALILGSDDGWMELVTVTGNIFRRNGAWEENEQLSDPKLSSHLVMKGCTGVVVTGNTMRVGKNDGDIGVLSPKYGFIISGGTNCIIKDNVMNNGATEQLIIADLAEDSTTEISNNIGNIAK